MKTNSIYTLAVGMLVLLSGCGTRQVDNAVKYQSSNSPAPTTHHVVRSPHWPYPIPDHVVIVMEENHSYQEIQGNPEAPFMNLVMKQGASFRGYHGVEHPSQPNYLDLFSGSNQGVTSDSCPNTFSGPNLASELIRANRSFGGYSEDLPSVGYIGCTSGSLFGSFGATYARKHNPWSNFTNVPARVNMPFTQFPKDYNKLPTISFVIPNLKHDMHSGSITDADKWLRNHIGAYAHWTMTHNSLLIVTWDEDDQSQMNLIPTFFVGGMVKSGIYERSLNHFNLLRTLEDMYGLKPLGKSAQVQPITNVWVSANRS